MKSASECVKAYEEQAALPGAAYGLELLDGGGLKMNPGTLTIVGADTNVGKSFMALTMAMNQVRASTEVYPFYISAEDSDGEVGRRVAPVLAGKVSGFPAETIDKVLFCFPDSSMEVALEAATEAVQDGATCVFVDYAQLFRLTGFSNDRRNEVATVARKWKDFARLHAVPVILLSQVKRMEGERYVLTLHDLAESADLERIADTVILMWKRQEDGKPSEDEVYAIIAKTKAKPDRPKRGQIYTRGEYGFFTEHSDKKPVRVQVTTGPRLDEMKKAMGIPF